MLKTTALFKALSHPTRLQILCLLLEGEVCVYKIMTILELPQSTASRHLAILKNARLVEDRRDGTWAHYSLARGHIAITDKLLELLGENLPQTREGAKDRQRLLDVLLKRNCA